MKTRLYHLWDTLTSSYWFVPALMLVAAGGLATGMLFVDRNVLQGPVESRWVYSGGAEGARALLSVVAGSVVTVAGVVFSITIAALTQASSQFGPRLLRNFMRDTGNQVVLGTFVATFLYCILVLRVIPGSGGGGGDPFVPHLSVTVAVGLAIASLCVLVYFIHHVSFSLQAPQVIARVWDELREALDRLNPERPGGRDGPAAASGGPAHEPPDPFGPDAGAVPADRSGYVQAVDEQALLAAAVGNDLRLKALLRPGKFAIRDAPIVLVWPASAATDRLRAAVNGAFIIGRHRTPEQDIEFAVDQLVEIAVRALSPGINDPFTACTCVDWLGESVCRVAAQAGRSAHRYDDRGTLRVVAAVPSFEGMVNAAFDQIRQYGRTSVSVTVRLLETIAAVAARLRDDDRRAALRRQAEMIHGQSRDAIPGEQDRRDVDERYHAAVRALDGATRA